MWIDAYRDIGHTSAAKGLSLQVTCRRRAPDACHEAAPLRVLRIFASAKMADVKLQSELGIT